MRFRTKSAGRRNAGLKLLVVTSALFSTAAAAADPCTAIRDRVLELKKNGKSVLHGVCEGLNADGSAWYRNHNQVFPGKDGA